MTLRRSHLPALLTLASLTQAGAQSLRTIDVDDYQRRLAGMWLGEVIANWTGLITEGARTEPPFFTDADWGVTAVKGQTIDFVLDQDPWWADDDTDIEYVYVHLAGQWGTPALTPEQIRDGWIAHINRFIWVSNANARALMDRDVRPPATSIRAANNASLRIDAQLTTEVFGALAPGCPMAALDLADLPIRTTASSHAAHAAQFFVVCYALATQIPPELTDDQAARWLVEQASLALPPQSKARQIARFVLESYLTNPDKDDWERTRDAVYDRYVLGAQAWGLKYRGWTESSVNFASAVIALLYGGLDYRRTVQIATLCGWDADNPAATLGGLLGLILGADGVRAQFPGVALSDRFWIARTRDNLPDYLPDDPDADDTFHALAQRMVPVVTAAIEHAGGYLDADRQRWILPPSILDPTRTPAAELDRRSANLRMLRAGTPPVALASHVGNPPKPAADFGLGKPDLLANGVEHDFSGIEPDDGQRFFFTFQGAGLAPGQHAWAAVLYPQPVQVHTVRFIEGDAFTQGAQTGGWFDTLSVELEQQGRWVPVPVGPGGATQSEPLDPDTPFQIIDFVLPQPVQATGVRCTGAVGGTAAFATIAELDALAPPDPLAPRGFDRNGDGRVDPADLYAFQRSPADLTGDGHADADDLALLLQAVARAPRAAEDHRSP